MLRYSKLEIPGIMVQCKLASFIIIKADSSLLFPITIVNYKNIKGTGLGMSCCGVVDQFILVGIFKVDTSDII